MRSCIYMGDSTGRLFLLVSDESEELRPVPLPVHLPSSNDTSCF